MASFDLHGLFRLSLLKLFCQDLWRFLTAILHLARLWKSWKMKIANILRLLPSRMRVGGSWTCKNTCNCSQTPAWLKNAWPNSTEKSWPYSVWTNFLFCTDNDRPNVNIITRHQSPPGSQIIRSSLRLDIEPFKLSLTIFCFLFVRHWTLWTTNFYLRSCSQRKLSPNLERKLQT